MSVLLVLVRAYEIRKMTKLTIVTGELNARGSRKHAVAPFPPAHARRLQKSRAEIVVERVVTRGVLPF